MALGRRTGKQHEGMIVLADLPAPPAAPFYERLNAVLDEADFDPFVEDLCRPYYADGVGRPGLPPGVYFRMLFVGYFEGLDSQRVIAWRCADSRSLGAFLGCPPTKATPDHSSLTKVRQRLPGHVHDRVFVFVLRLARQEGLLRGKTVGVDSTTLEANAAMKGIVRKDTGEDYQHYLKRLLGEQGVNEPTAEAVRRFDKGRKKKASNKEWQSPTDPDSRIAKMKDGTTHLAYKAEHVVDLDSEFVLAAGAHAADRSDGDSLVGSVVQAQVNLVLAGSEQEIEEAVTDKGYHKAQTLVDCAACNTRTYIPEPEGKEYNWRDKPAAWRPAVRANRRRLKGSRNKRLQKRRSELVERSFAQVCETGGARRSWLRGLLEVSKRYVVTVAAHNLGRLLHKLFGVGKPRILQGAARLLRPLAHGLDCLSGLAGRNAGRPAFLPAAAGP